MAPIWAYFDEEQVYWRSTALYDLDDGVNPGNEKYGDSSPTRFFIFNFFKFNYFNYSNYVNPGKEKYGDSSPTRFFIFIFLNFF